MILFYILGFSALVLNILGRILILRRDQDLQTGWQRALKLLPGAELLYLVFRWEKARVGCIVCGISIGLLVPVAHHFLGSYAAGKFADLLAPGRMTADVPASSREVTNPVELKRLAEYKERKLTEVNQYLAQWYQSLTIRQGFLCDEMPEETLEYNRLAAAYKDLMRVWKAERQETDALKARL
jgi:hypothetical protein